MLAAVGLGLVGPAPAQDRTVVELAGQSEARGFRTGILVRDLRSGRDLFRHRSREVFTPASNQKLVTAAAALWGLGAGYRFATGFRVRGGVLEVVAAGDPNWLHGTRNDPAVIFAGVARELRGAGITRLRDLRLVTGPFTGPDRPPGWPAAEFQKTYAAPTGGLVLEAGCFEAEVAPGSREARVTMIAPPVRIPFEGSMGMTGKRNPAYWLSHSGKTFTAHGQFSRRAAATRVRGVCQDPEWLFTETLRQVLAQHGIAFDREAGRRDLDLSTHESDLRTALAETLIESSNFHAEQLLRVLGAEHEGVGNFAAGCAAVREIVAARVPAPAGLAIVDGSGLSRGNRVTPEFLVGIVEALCKGPDAKLLVQCLPQGGVSGTLRSRFRGKGLREVGLATRAKTGYVAGVRTLTGFVQAADGTVRLFSILMNRREGTGTAGTKALQDRIVAAVYHGRYE